MAGKRDVQVDLIVDPKKAVQGAGKAGDAMQDFAHEGEQDVNEFAEAADQKLELFAGRARKHATDVKSAITSNIAQAVAGSIDSTASLETNVEGILSGLALALPGPIGAAFGLVGGLIAGAMQQASSTTEKSLEEEKKAIADWADAWEKSSGEVIDSAILAANVTDITKNRMDEVNQAVKDWGVSQSTVVNALAGNQSAIAEVNASLDAQASKLSTVKRATEEASTAYQNYINENTNNPNAAQDAQARALQQTYADLEGQYVTLKAQNDAASASFGKLNDQMSKGKDYANANSEALKQLIETTSGATEQVDALGNALVTLPDGAQIVISADTGRASTELDAFKGDVDTLTAHAYDLSKVAQYAADALKQQAAAADEAAASDRSAADAARLAAEASDLAARKAQQKADATNANKKATAEAKANDAEAAQIAREKAAADDQAAAAAKAKADASAAAAAAADKEYTDRSATLTTNIVVNMPDPAKAGADYRSQLQAYFNAHPMNIDGNIVTRNASGGKQLQ